MTQSQAHHTFGDMIAAAFDRAGLVSDDPKEVSRLALQAITRRLGIALQLPDLSPGALQLRWADQGAGLRRVFRA